MRILHTADLHLDSVMESCLPAERARERRGELLLAFRSMIDWARSNAVDAVLLVGDLFDTAQVSAKTRQYVADVIASAPELDFFYVRGNHDRFDLRTCFAGSALPPNLFLFLDEAGQGGSWICHRRGSVALWGREPGPQDDPAADPAADLQPAPTDHNIVLVHGQLSEGRKVLPEQILLRSYRGRNIDYLALGHIHSFRAEPLSPREKRGRGVWCYPGCPAGRGFDECGEKGFAVYDTQQGGLPEFIPLPGRRLREVEVDCTDLAGLADLEARVRATTEALPQEDLLKVILTGSVPPDTHLDTGYLTTLLSGRFYFAKVVSATHLLLDPASYRDDISLKGQFIRQVLADGTLDETQRERIIACGLRALAGEDPLP